MRRRVRHGNNFALRRNGYAGMQVVAASPVDRHAVSYRGVITVGQSVTCATCPTGITVPHLPRPSLYFLAFSGGFCVSTSPSMAVTSMAHVAPGANFTVKFAYTAVGTGFILSRGSSILVGFVARVADGTAAARGFF